MLDLRETTVGAICNAGLPLDVANVRLQTQGPRGIYTGLNDVLAKTARQEGVRALWKGATPALSSAILETSVLFTAQGAIKRLVFAGRPALYRGAAGAALHEASLGGRRLCVRGHHAVRGDQVPPSDHDARDLDRRLRPPRLDCPWPQGLPAGSTGWAFVFPADVIKSRMQVGTTSGFAVAVRPVWQTQGRRGFYPGWSPAVLRSFPADGSLFLGVEMTHRVFGWMVAQDASRVTTIPFCKDPFAVV
ncbi:Aste57867_24526 [Aphanomyces stellatus]|uniref:Aste57867_24526 protein n=1 Tax=Aphanomyces stellatus TaxID=120398 RepID=A0A485LQV6_9STRA|nr:hypothetical protein As57867_024449 [Aphanomyces stellatus]VFU01165.1 Aste57867_24526 [Aphanomyces stellatus]